MTRFLLAGVLALLAVGAARAQPAAACASVAGLAAGDAAAAAFLDVLGRAGVCFEARGAPGRTSLGRLARVVAATASADTTTASAAAASDTTLAGRLAALRRRHPVLARGAFVPLAADSAARAVAFARRLDADELVVIVNAGDTEARLVLPPALARAALVPLLASRGDVEEIPSLLLVFYESGATDHAHPVPPRTAVVFRRAEAADVRPRGLDE